MNITDLLRKNLHANAERRATLQRELSALDVDDHKINNAIEVISALNPDEFQQSQEVRARPIYEIQKNIPMPGGKVSVKSRVLKELEKASPLTKMDIVSRLHAGGHPVNSTTVGSLLSKMVGTEVEKAGPAAYRLKGESPVGTGLSDATMSTPDEL